MRTAFRVLAATALLCLAGCATTTRTETTVVYADKTQVRPADQVQISTKDGRKLEFRVTKTDAKTVYGEGVTVARADIQTMKAATGTKTVQTTESNAQPAAQAIGTLGIVFGVIAVVGILAVF